MSTSSPLLSRTTSEAITAALAVIILLVASAYISALHFLRRFWAGTRSKSSTAKSVSHDRNYDQAYYALLIFFSILEISVATWLLAQYNHVGHFSTLGVLDGLRLSLFAASWTMVSATVYIVLSLHPRLRYNIVLSTLWQAPWVLVSWCLWVAATATLNRALPLLYPKANCAGADFCTQLQAAFGFALTHVLVFTIGMLVVSWQVTRLWYRHGKYAKRQQPSSSSTRRVPPPRY